MINPASGKKLEDIVFVGFDTETTGLSPIAARLVELSAVKFRIDGSVLSDFSRLINPECEIPLEACAVHGISNEMVKGQPTYREVVPEFLDWLGQEDVVLAAHNASFDIGFIEIALSRLGLAPPVFSIVDTLSLCRRLLPQAPNHQLKTLVEYLKLAPGGYHRALADSYHVKDLLLKMLPLMPDCRAFGDIAGFCDIWQFSDLRETGFAAVNSLPERFEPIKQAISASLDISLVYDNGQASTRTVTPHSVHNWRNTLYLTGFCHASGAERTFRLDRIVSFRILTE